jgi:UDP-glucuronate 4-epimerase
LALLDGKPNFTFHRQDITDRAVMDELFNHISFDSIVHLAAEVGVRNTSRKLSTYIDTNIVGFSNILEGARKQVVPDFIFASSSAVYGNNKNTPPQKKTR